MLYFYLICTALIVIMMIHISLRDKPRFQRNRILSLDLFRYADISDALKVIQDEADIISVEYPEKKLGEFLLILLQKQTLLSDLRTGKRASKRSPEILRRKSSSGP